MTCALCGGSNVEGAAFCSHCGVSLGPVCPDCGAANNPRARRCGACGRLFRIEAPARPAPRAPRESRRIVTVLFADIVGYTSLVEAHAQQTEALRSTLQACFDALGAIVLEHGGIVEKFIGDAICALFGAPVVHEDDPARALACGLSMQAWMQEFNLREAANKPEEPLRLRIGVSTGEVVGGTSAHGGQEQYSVTGDAVNTASRLQTLAQPGQVLAGEDTERLTRSGFTFESIGEVKLKGKRAAIEAFVLGGARGNVETSGAFVNRRRERDRLHYLLDLAKAGDPQLLEIVGDAGIGKSSLLDAFLDSATDANVLLRGSCPAMAARPLHPFLSIVDSLLEVLDESATEGEPKAAGTLLRRLVAEKAATAPDVPTEAVADAILTLVRVGNPNATVIVVENVHRADPDSLDLLQCLAARIRGERLLLIWTRRTGEEAFALSDIAVSFSRLVLNSLSEADSRVLLDELLKDRKMEPDIEHLIVARSAGNPLYIEAMVGTYLEDGRDLLSGDTLEIPTTVRGLIQARLDSLPEAQRLTAQEAAVVGREFDARLLQAVDLFGLDVAASLEALSQRGMIEQRAGDNFAFRHVLTQEVCYNTMLEALRSELHREVADTMAEMFPNRLRDLAPARADHYAKAGDTDRAVEVLVESGGEA